ncbi:MAG: chorismate synthase [Candidatus Riflebacteria bacterium]|nr:chorismate synthase [Candidatus Riflebacteria bacterium]
MTIRYLTAGESHGPALCGIIDGMPAGIKICEEDFAKLMKKRQSGYGRGKRCQIEPEKVEVLSGIVGGKTTGSPISLLIRNADYENHKAYMHPFNEPSAEGEILIPLPGHADLAGAIKYGLDNCRIIRERASARETAMRTALSVPARNMLYSKNITSVCLIESIGGAESRVDYSMPEAEIKKMVEKNGEDFLTMDSEIINVWKSLIDEAKANKNSLGGTGCVIFYGLPIGLGSHVQSNRRLDSIIAAAVMSVPAIKGVEIGYAKALSEKRENSTDGIRYDSDKKLFTRTSNFAGGLEGGMTNGQPLVLRFHMKPLPANSRSESVNLKTLQPAYPESYRSDVCAIQAACIVVESVVYLALANEMA